MEHIKHIVELEARARQFGLSPRQLYLRAGVPCNNMSRWKNGHSSPGIVRWRETIVKLNKVLAEVATERMVS
jgi:hypothetical protein